MQDGITPRKRLSKNFYEDEFICKCGRCSFKEWVDPYLIELLQYIRDNLMEPMNVTSGARCVYWNDHINGSKNSKHIVTKWKPSRAADISTVHMYSEDKWKIVQLAMKAGVGGLGIAKNFIHLDVGKRKAIWNY